MQYRATSWILDPGALYGAASSLFERGPTPRVELMMPLVVDAEVVNEVELPELASDVVTISAMIS